MYVYIFCITDIICNIALFCKLACKLFSENEFGVRMLLVLPSAVANMYDTKDRHEIDSAKQALPDK